LLVGLPTGFDGEHGNVRAGGVDSAGDMSGASSMDSASGVSFEALVKSVTESVMAAIAEKYTLVPRK
jgi:hypothetical protein